jgi:hypothetical protein
VGQAGADQAFGTMLSSGSAAKLASGRSSTPKAMLTTPPARSDGFDHKGGSEPGTYSQGLTGRQGVAWLGGAWFGCRPRRCCKHGEALEWAAWSERADELGVGRSPPSWRATLRQDTQLPA